MGQRRGYGGQGSGAGPPRACKCTQWGYEPPKTPGVPCMNFKCPECGALLWGADRWGPMEMTIICISTIDECVYYQVF